MGRFDALSPWDFEVFVADLLSQHLDLDFRVGAAGADGGIDALSLDASGSEHALQCKHAVRSTWAQVRASAVSEREKLAKRPRRLATYRFVTSAELTFKRRQELAEVLAPFAKTANDVLGNADLLRLLREHPQVERRHLKLWLSETSQLENMLGAAAFERSRALLEQCREDLPRWVQTNVFTDARARLERHGLCVIAGPAGVGKTTLARLLLLAQVDEGFEPIEVTKRDLDSAWRSLSNCSAAQPMVFLFDDFLGETALAPARDADRDLVRFFQRVASRPHAQLILATREYIVRRGLAESEVLDTSGALDDRVILQISDLSREDRARIFLNHLWASPKVSPEHVESLRVGRRYLDIIDHPQFTPRGIERITGLTGRGSAIGSAGDYGDWCLQQLEHPARMWDYSFRQGIEEPERALLIAMLGMPERLAIGHLESAFERSCLVRNLPATNQGYNEALRVLEGSFISSSAGRRQITLSMLNPSLTDYLTGYLNTSNADALAAIHSAAFFEQTVFLCDSLAGADTEASHLHGPLAEALRRTFRSPEIVGDLETSVVALDHVSRFAGRPHRMLTLARTMKQQPHLRSRLSSWLSELAHEWLISMDADEVALPASASALDLLRRLEVITPATCVTALLRAIGPDPDLSPLEPIAWFEVLAEARRLHGKNADEHFWRLHERRAHDWVESALSRPDGVVEDDDDLQVLEAVVDAFELPHGDDLAALARYLDEQQDIADHERASELQDYEADDRPRHWPPRGDSNAAIDALFRDL